MERHGIIAALLVLAACGAASKDTGSLTDATDTTDAGSDPEPTTPAPDTADTGSTTDPVDTATSDTGTPGPTGTPGVPACVDVVLGGVVPQLTTGNTVGAGDDVASSCSVASGGAPDLVYQFVAPSAGSYGFRVTADFWTMATLLDGCAGPSLQCTWGEPGTWTMVQALAAGQSVLAVVDGFAGYGPAAGDFDLEIVAVQATDLPCDDQSDADFDGFTDCLDADCAGDPVCAPVCPRDPVGAPPWSTLVDTTGLPDEHTLSCGSYNQSSDYTFSFVAPSAGTWTFDTSGGAFPAAVAVLDGCGGAELACDQFGGPNGAYSVTSAELTAGQEVVVVVEGAFLLSGEIVLNVQ